MSKNNQKKASTLQTTIRLFSLLSKKERAKSCFFAVFAIFNSIFEILTATVVVVFVQVLTRTEDAKQYFYKIKIVNINDTSDMMIISCLILVALYILKSIISAGEIFYQNYLIQNITYSFKSKLLSQYTACNYQFYLSRNSLFGHQVLSGDVDFSMMTGLLALSSIFSEGSILVGLVCFVIYMNPAFFFIISGVGVILSLITVKFILPNFYYWGEKMQEASLLTSQKSVQFFQAFKEMVLFGNSEAFIKEYNVHSLVKSKISFIQNSLSSLPRIIIELVFILVFSGVVFYLSISTHDLSELMGVLGGYFYAAFRLMPGVNRILSQTTIFKTATPYIDRVYEEYTMEYTKSNYIHQPDLKFQKSIQFNNVSFKHTNSKNLTLKNISFEINKRDCIGIVGETGSGKTTLINILLGIIRPNDGQVLLDGCYDPYSCQWHKKVGYVSQSIYLIDDTIKANIIFGQSADSYDQKKINEVIKASQLEKLIKKLPEGINSQIGDRGVRLSGGEKQRIAIARALFRNPEIIIFDEATSALDSQTEADIMQTLYEVKGDKTIIMIAHRISTLKNCNKIIALKDGYIDKICTYNDLFPAQNAKQEIA